MPHYKDNLISLKLCPDSVSRKAECCSEQGSNTRRLTVPFAHLTGLSVLVPAGETEESGHSHRQTIWGSHS